MKDKENRLTENEDVKKAAPVSGRLTHADDGVKTRRKRDETTFSANGRASP